MPKVEQYGPQRVFSDITQGPRARELPATAFGDGGAALRSLGKVAGEISTFFDEASAREATVQFEREKNKLFADPESGYFNLKGKAAFEGQQAAIQSLDDLKKRYAEGLKSPRARRAFEAIADRHITDGRGRIMTHASNGLRLWETETNKAQVENTIENASIYWNDEKSLSVQRQLGRDSVRAAAEMEGIDGDALKERLETFDSSFASAAISAALAQSPDAAEAALKKHGDLLEGDARVKLQNAIDTKRRIDDNRLISEEAVVLGGKYFDDIQGTIDDRAVRAEGLKQIRAEIEDPKLRKRVESEFESRIAQRDRIHAEQREAAIEMADQALLVDNMTVDQFIAQNPEEWSRIPARNQAAYAKKADVVTDQEVMNRLFRLRDDVLAKTDLTQYRGQLSKSDYGKLITMQRKAIAGESNAIEKNQRTQVNATIKKMFPKHATNDEQGLKAARFRDLVEEEFAARVAAKGETARGLTNAEYAEMLNDMSRQIVLNEEFLGFDLLNPDTEVDIITLSDQLGISAKDLSDIEAYLRDNDVPITVETLTNAYRQLTQ